MRVTEDVGSRMRALRATGVPYSLTQQEYEANVKKFGQAVADKLDIHRAQETLLQEARDKNFDGLPGRVTEMDALVAYLQSLGTMVDFSQYNDDAFVKFHNHPETRRPRWGIAGWSCRIMFDWLSWFTHMENSVPLALILFFGAFCGVLLYVFTGKKRGQRLESHIHSV